MRRRPLLWLAGLALVVGALLLTDRLLWQPGLTEDNVRRIRPGMALAEVEALLGGPAAEGNTLPPASRQEPPAQTAAARAGRPPCVRASACPLLLRRIPASTTKRRPIAHLARRQSRR